MIFYIVPADIALTWQHRKEGHKELFFLQDNKGRYVVNIEVAGDWPQINWNDFKTETLTVDDFPTPENILNDGTENES